MLTPVRRALLSVSDKTGIVEFARALKERGIELLSTGGTAQLLVRHGISVKEVAEHTGFPEIMGGRVKTLHPKIHGGLLGRRGLDEDVMREHGIEPIDLLVVNLYPFAATVARPDCSYEDAVENIDIGGPAMVRAAAKNHASVTVVVDPGDYRALLDELAANQGATDTAMRRRLAAKAFAHTAQYDAMVSAYFTGAIGCGVRDVPGRFESVVSQALRSALRREPAPARRVLRRCARDRRIGGARQAAAGQGAFVQQHRGQRHGARVRAAIRRAGLRHRQARQSLRRRGRRLRQPQPTSWPIAPTRRPRSAASSPSIESSPAAAARAILERQFVEVILAPGGVRRGKSLLAAKSEVRVLETGDLRMPVSQLFEYQQRHRRPAGADARQRLGAAARNCGWSPSARPPRHEREDLLFAWRVAKYVKSNAIVCAKDKATIGIGAGQMSRVVSSKIAALKARDEGLIAARGLCCLRCVLPVP